MSEFAAAGLLIAKGYRILERRYRCAAGEIDIIAKRGARLAFVEVKLRATMEESEWALTARQAERIMRAADTWISRHPGLSHMEMGMDLILVAPGRLPRHVTNAFHRPWDAWKSR